MKILVAAPKPAHSSKWNDFAFTNDAELLRLGSTCCSKSTCGCARSMIGMDTQKGTTVFQVIETDLTRENFIKRYAESLARAGYPYTAAEVEEESDELLRYASFFAEGANIRFTKSGKSLREA